MVEIEVTGRSYLLQQIPTSMMHLLIGLVSMNLGCVILGEGDGEMKLALEY
jgi:hypothetical protein